MNKTSFLNIILPGILVAATGVGAGDLATASIAGSELGLAILWAVVVGGILKYYLTEGLARWQLTTGQSFLEGVLQYGGRISGILFLGYMILWSFFVGSALMSACGATLHAMIPVFEDAVQGKIIFGLTSSLISLGLISLGGFKLFEKIMGVCIGIMFITVVVLAALLWPGTSEVFSGLFIPSIPDASGAGVDWTTALIGGVGGTLTILCYGYWIREKGRTGVASIKICRIDLFIGYAMTIIFGLAMVIIGSTISIEGSGARLLITLAESVKEPLGTTGQWFFLIGAFCAIFSSMLGVWQSIPYLFADIWQIFFIQKEVKSEKNLTQNMSYKIYMIGLALIPAIGLFYSFKEIQKLYAIIGALFIPLLAIALLVMNAKRDRLKNHVNSLFTTAILIATVLFFVYLGWVKFTA